MHVGLNLIFLVPDETGGMETAARELIPALIAQAPTETHFTAFVNREAASVKGAPWNELLPCVTVPVNASNRIQWVFGEQVLLPSLAARAGVDLMHSLASTAPGRGRFRRVATIHDLIYTHYPDTHEGIRNKGMGLLIPLAVRNSHRVIAISQRTRQDLIDLLCTPSGKIDVVPQGPGGICRVTPLDAEATRARLSLGDRQVILALSAKRPHKNLSALIGALAKIQKEVRPLLVLPGYPTWHESELREHARTLGIESDVCFAGWLAPEELEGLWSLAAAFVYPSLYEGFGLPVLEAMARGVPVACSNTSSLPEVAGNAALFFDPHDELAISHAIERLVHDRSFSRNLRNLGIARAAKFTWEQTASMTLETYARALGPERASVSPALAL